MDAELAEVWGDRSCLCMEGPKNLSRTAALCNLFLCVSQQRAPAAALRALAPRRLGHHLSSKKDVDPTRWPQSPRIVMRCAPRASNGPNHLGLCALQVRADGLVDTETVMDAILFQVTSACTAMHT